MDEFRYSRKILNVVVVGQSGVGKSSFLNYVADKEVFATGVGGAVTKGYFDRHETIRNGVNFMLYDTEGLEPGKVDEWERNILSEIKKRDGSRDMSDWFHSLLFCISAEAKRVQPFEIDAIKRMSAGGHVMVLLTKKDKVEGKVLEDLRDELLRQVGDQIEILSVCSVSQRFRNGKVSHRAGLDEVLEKTFVGLWKKMAKMMPSVLLSQVSEYTGRYNYCKDVPSLISWGLINDKFEPYQLNSFCYLCLVFKLPTNSVSKNTKVDFSTFNEIKKKEYQIVCLSDNLLEARIKGYYTEILKLPLAPSKDILDWGLFRSGLRKYLIDWWMTYSSLIYALKSIDTEKICNDLQKVINICSNLYVEITGQCFEKKVSMYDIEENLKHLKELEKQASLEKYYTDVKRGIKEVDNCVLFNSSERDYLMKSYDIFKSNAEEFLNKYSNALGIAKNAIRQELRSYADYTIR